MTANLLQARCELRLRKFGLCHRSEWSLQGVILSQFIWKVRHLSPGFVLGTVQIDLP